MATGINTNIASLNAQRNLNASQGTLSKTLQRLSSGLRINSAADDSAGLAIAERFTTQIRGLNQAVRNASDGISMLQTAEGALTSVTDNLQRIRELAVQAANATNSASDREALQREVSQLTAEIDRVGKTTTFNGEKVFGQSNGSVVGDPAVLEVLDGLRSGWLSNAETLIKDYYGIEATADVIGIELTTFSDGPSGVLALVNVSWNGGGQATSITLRVDMSDFVPITSPDGGNAPIYNDRILAHEMVHAVMDATMNIGSFFNNNQQFFLEGTAELIHGGDERLFADLGGSAAGIPAIMAEVDDWGLTWSQTTQGYSAGYAGMRYLDSEIKAAGGQGIKDVMMYLAADSSRTLDQALTNATHGRFASFANFKAEFQADGAAFIGNLLSSGQLTDQDTGAIGGANASGGPIRNAQSVVPNGATRSGDDQLEGFIEEWEELNLAQNFKTATKQLQVGANVGEILEIDQFAMSGTALDILDTDVSTNPNRALSKIDRALDYINARRADLGAQLNRLDSTISNLSSTSESLTASRSRIQDADFAVETASLTRAQILQQAGTAILAQANSNPQMVLKLLS